MKKIICLQNHWSVGEGLRTINQVLTLIEFLRKIYSEEELYFVLNFLDDEFIVENCIDIKTVSIVPDETYIKNYEYSYNKVLSDGYRPIIPGFHTFAKNEDLEKLNSTEFFYKGKKYFGIQEAISIYIDECHSHNVNKITYSHNLNESDFINHEGEHKCYVSLNPKIEKYSSNILNMLDKHEYESIFYRWEEGYDKEKDYKQIESYVNILSNFLDKNKNYFLSSNNPVFYEIFKKKFKNCFYIDRGIFSTFSHLLNIKETIPSLVDCLENKIIKLDNNKIPDIFEPNLTHKTVSEYIAHIELNLICKSKRIFYMTNERRDNISLFLWLAILKNSIELNWINVLRGEVIKRKYNFDKCLFEEKIKF
jgi:hypothetical protein